MQLRDDQEVEDASGLDTHFDNAEARVANHTSGSYRVVFFNWPPLKSSKYKKVNLGEVRYI